jgi:hypothetical protein
VHYLGWSGAFGALAVFPVLGIGLLMTIHLKDEPSHPQDEADRGEKAASIKARV